MRILADANAPEEYVPALRGDGHEVTSGGPAVGADDDITAHAESEGSAVLSTVVPDFAGRNAEVPVLVAPQDTTGGEVRAAVAQSHLARGRTTTLTSR